MSRVRPSSSGGVLIEIPGDGGAQKANSLASKLREILPTRVSISRPVKKGELSIRGLDSSVLKEELLDVLAHIGECSLRDIKLSKLQIMRTGLRVVWVQLSLKSAIKIAQRVQFAWTTVQVELLKARLMQCFRCRSFGHIAAKCTAPINRRGTCFDCGQRP